MLLLVLFFSLLLITTADYIESMFAEYGHCLPDNPSSLIASLQLDLHLLNPEFPVEKNDEIIFTFILPALLERLSKAEAAFIIEGRFTVNEECKGVVDLVVLAKKYRSALIRKIPIDALEFMKHLHSIKVPLSLLHQIPVSQLPLLKELFIETDAKVESLSLPPIPIIHFDYNLLSLSLFPFVKADKIFYGNSIFIPRKGVQLDSEFLLDTFFLQSMWSINDGSELFLHGTVIDLPSQNAPSINPAIKVLHAINIKASCWKSFFSILATPWKFHLESTAGIPMEMLASICSRILGSPHPQIHLSLPRMSLNSSAFFSAIFDVKITANSIHLNFAYNPIGDEGFKVLVNQLILLQNSSFHLNLSYCSLTQASKRFLNKLLNAVNVEFLDLRGNELKNAEKEPHVLVEPTPFVFKHRKLK